MTRCKLFLVGCAICSLLVTMQTQLQASTLPTTSASVIARYDASSLALGNGASVGTWTATAGPDANAEGASSSPTFLTGFSPTGLPGVVFDGGAGADDRMLIGRNSDADPNPALADTEAIFVVLQMNSTGFPEQQQIIGADGLKVMGVRNSTLFTTDQPAAGNINFSDTTGLHVLSWVRGKPLRIDGFEPTGSNTADAPFAQVSIIGDERLSPPDNPGPGMTFGEIILYNNNGAAMSDSDRANVETHLMSKWLGIPEPTSLALLAMGGLALTLRRRT